MVHITFRLNMTSNTDEETHATESVIPKAPRRAITVEQIQVFMKWHATSPIIAYYIIREDLYYVEAIMYYRQHHHHVSLVEQEQLAKQVGYDPEHPDEKKRFDLAVKLAQAEFELTEEEVKLLFKVDYDGKPFNCPVPGEVMLTRCRNPYDMGDYSSPELEAEPHYKGRKLALAERQRHREAIAKIKAAKF